MLKKLVSLFLAIVAVISLCACGGDSSDDSGVQVYIGLGQAF